MNIYDEHPFKVILDYAHNPAAVRAMCGLVDRFEVEGKRIVVLSAPGDRRDEDILDSVKACIREPGFTHFVCKADNNRRGRGYDEIPQLLRKYIIEQGIPEENVWVIADEEPVDDE